MRFTRSLNCSLLCLYFLRTDKNARLVLRKSDHEPLRNNRGALKRLALLGALLMLTACQSTTQIAVTDTSCQAFEPIRYSRSDTAETVRQVRQHNAAFRTLCDNDNDKR